MKNLLITTLTALLLSGSVTAADDPLSADLMRHTRSVCDAYGVPVSLALERERDAHPIDTAALYGDDFDKAMLELARVAHTVAEHFDMPFVTAAAFYQDRDGSNRGHAYGQRRNQEFTDTMRDTPQEDEK